MDEELAVRSFRKNIRGYANPKSLSSSEGRSKRRKEAAYVRPVAPGELKSIDLPSQTFGFDTTGTTVCVNMIRVGTSFNNRVGRSIRLRSIRIRGEISVQAATVLQSFCRLLVVYDKQPNGAPPAITDVLQDQDQGTAQATNSKCGYNLSNRDRFVIIHDESFVMGNFTTGVANGFPSPTSKELSRNWYKKLNLKTVYGADTSPAVITDIRTGSLLIMTLGDQGAASGYNFQATCRVRFVD